MPSNSEKFEAATSNALAKSVREKTISIVQDIVDQLRYDYVTEDSTILKPWYGGFSEGVKAACIQIEKALGDETS